MPYSLTLTVTKGQLKSKQFRYDQHETLIIGRENDCAIVLPEDTISRYHCLMDIALPSVMVSDFGSMNGTYINGLKIGQRPKGTSAEESKKYKSNEIRVKSGDILGIGNKCEIRIDITEPLYCADCFDDLSVVQYKNHNGLPICGTCNLKKKQKAPPALKCEICGKKLTYTDKGYKLCSDCRRDVSKALKHIVNTGNINKETVKGLDKYKKIKRLGAGGMGEVWLAEEIETGFPYALKFMLPQASIHESSRNTFIREALVMSQLDHKNVVKHYEFGQIGDSYFIVMEYCPGGNIEDLMRIKGGKLDLQDATFIILQALDGLIYTHNASIKATLKNGEQVCVNGVVHRDFKPANIFLAGDKSNPIIKVADFGLAKAFESAGLTGHTATGQSCGTPVFMPRQQVMDYKYSKPQVDVWAAAASYYYMLTGKYPKEFTNKSMLLDAINNQAIPIRSHDPRIPKELAVVIDTALVDKPEIKIKSAAELKRLILESFA